MSTNSVTLHRVLKAAPEKIFRAFTEPHFMASWFPPYGFACSIQEMNAVEGGTYKMTFHNFTTGNAHSFGGKFIELKPAETIKLSDQFDDPNLPGEMTTTVTFEKTSVGTHLRIVQEDIPAAIPVEMCYLGWQDSLDKLIRLVEPEIPDA